jgi:hypothetical protein
LSAHLNGDNGKGAQKAIRSGSAHDAKRFGVRRASTLLNDAPTPAARPYHL